MPRMLLNARGRSSTYGLGPSPTLNKLKSTTKRDNKLWIQGERKREERKEQTQNNSSMLRDEGQKEALPSRPDRFG